MSIVLLSADWLLEESLKKNSVFLVTTRTTRALTRSGLIGRVAMIIWNVPAMAVLSKGIVNEVGLVTVTACVPTMADSRLVLT